MTTINTKRKELNRLADQPISSSLRRQAFVEMSQVMRETLAELRMLCATLREETQTTRARSAALQAESARLRDRLTP
jgi:signal transduction histidine kinase